MKDWELQEDVDYRRAGLGGPANKGGKNPDGTPKKNELTPHGERLLEQLVKQWELLKSRQQKNKIDELRMRADVAESIRDCYSEGVSRAVIANKLQVQTSRITQLVNGNYIPGPHARKLPVAPTWSPEVQGRVIRYMLDTLPADALEGAIAKAEVAPKPEVKTLCYYCTQEAQYVVEYTIPNGETKERVVCKAHKPMAP